MRAEKGTVGRCVGGREGGGGSTHLPEDERMRQPVARDEHRAEPEVQPLVGGAEHARDAADADPGEADDQGDDA